jgi:hypothetical protein
MVQYLAWAWSLRAQFAYRCGDPTASAGAAQAAQCAWQLATDYGSTPMTVEALLGRGAAALLGGMPGEAEAAFEGGIALARKQRAGRFEEPSLLAHLALARLSLGDLVAARNTVDEALEVARSQAAGPAECLAQVHRARILRRSARTEDASGALDEGDRLVAETGATTWAPFLAEERARLAGDRAALTAAGAGYAEIGAHGHAARLGAELAAG